MGYDVTDSGRNPDPTGPGDSSGPLLQMKPKSTLSGHKGPILTITYSSGQGQYILTSSVDRQIRLFNPTHGPNPSAIQTYNPATPVTLSLSVSHGSSHFASSGANDRSVLLWDVATGSIVRRFSGHNGRVNTVTFGGGGDDGPDLGPAISRWHASKDDPSGRKNMTGSSGGASGGLTRDTTLISGGQDRCVKIWDLRAGRDHYGGDRRLGGGSSGPSTNQAMMTFRDAQDAISDVHVRGPEIYAASYDGRIRIYDVRKGVLTTDLIGPDPVTSVDPSRRPAGKNQHPYLVASISTASSFPSVQLMERVNGRMVNRFKPNRSDPDSHILNSPSLQTASSDLRVKAVFGPSEAHVISTAPDGHAYIWNITTGAVVGKVKHSTSGNHVHITDVAVCHGSALRAASTSIVARQNGWAPEWEWCTAGSDGNVVCWTLAH